MGDADVEAVFGGVVHTEEEACLQFRVSPERAGVIRCLVSKGFFLEGEEQFAVGFYRVECLLISFLGVSKGDTQHEG